MDRQFKYVAIGAAIGLGAAWFLSGPNYQPSEFEFTVAAIVGGWIAYNIEQSS